MPRTLLAHLAPATTIQIENHATSAVYFLLAKYRPAKEEFLSLARSVMPTLPEIEEYHTQARWDDGAIPDMSGSASGVEVLLLETKFYAGLTPNQPLKYFDRLNTPSGGLLLFLCPEARAHRFWKELADLCQEQPDLLLSDGQSPLPGMIAARASHNRHLGLLTWETLLSRLESALHAANELGAVADVDQLRGLCEWVDAQNLNRPNLGDPVAAGDHWKVDLTLVVDELADGIALRGHTEAGLYRATPGSGYYKRYMTFRGLPDWCVEWNLDYLGTHGQSSLWFTTTVTRSLKARIKRLGASLPFRNLLYGNQYLVPLCDVEGLSRPELVSHILGRVDEIARYLDASAEET